MKSAAASPLSVSAASPGLTRRSFLALAGAASVGMQLLASACAPVAPAPSAASATPQGQRARLTMPSFLPAQGPPPDFPGNDKGLQPAYARYPSALVKSVAQAPGLGGDVAIFTQTPSALPPPLEQNAAWRAINGALNANLKLQLVPTTDYQTRVATIMAGNDLPELFYLNENLTIANVPQFLQSAYTDLAPYIAGDAIKDYPNLGALPTIAWRQSVFGNGVYAVPVVRPFQFGVFINKTMFDAAGVGQPTTAQEFKQALVQLTRPGDNQYGMAAIAPGYGVLNQQMAKGETPMLAMFGAPNNWALESGGAFVKDFETEQFRAALSFVRELHAAGVFFPDPSLTQTTMRNHFLGGRVGVIATGWGNYGTLLWNAGLRLNPPIIVRALRPFSHDGSPPVWHSGNQMAGITAIKKTSPERTRELLRVLNFLAAPFGTQEFHLLNYGVEGVDHQRDNQGNPILTPQGEADVNVGGALRYVGRPMDVLFNPSYPDFAAVAHADAQAMTANLMHDPSLGLDSPTDRAKGKQLLQKVYDGVGDIIVGRAPLTDLDQIIQAWRTTGGDQVRSELEQSLAAQA